MIAFPNAKALDEVVASYTNFPHLRLDVDVTVAVTENLGRIRELLLAIVAKDPAYMPEPAAEVHVQALKVRKAG